MAQNEPSNPVLVGRDLSAILRQWEERHNSPGYDPEPVVTR